MSENLNSNIIDNENSSFELFIKIDSLQNINLNKFGVSLDFVSSAKNKVISLTKVLLKKAESQVKKQTDVKVDKSLQSAS